MALLKFKREEEPISGSHSPEVEAFLTKLFDRGHAAHRRKDR